MTEISDCVTALVPSLFKMTAIAEHIAHVSMYCVMFLIPSVWGRPVDPTHYSLIKFTSNEQIVAHLHTRQTLALVWIGDSDHLVKKPRLIFLEVLIFISGGKYLEEVGGF